MRLRRLWERAGWLAGTGLVVGLVALAIGGPASYVLVHETAKSDFCLSCHIMEPFYESWEHSAHNQVACIQCHYEPGAVETFVGKFQALSQVAKYFTQTQGTRPWAEVSDASCMRMGCHSVRTLEGPIDYEPRSLLGSPSLAGVASVAFDHGPHLLDTTPGRRLQCVSCHSQVVQSEHFSVETSVCFTCHFMPESDGNLPPARGECTTCHRSLPAALEVAGLAFDHDEYVRRGVACAECHDSITEGRGTVRIARCRSCHGEEEYVERFGETVYLHEQHVSSHKVECFECHDEIQHGLTPRQPPAALAEGCGNCHADSHGASGELFTGSGAHGVAPRPSRMFETRVACAACHTGRSRPHGGEGHHDSFHGAASGGHGAASAGHGVASAGHGVASAGHGVASAGNVDCIHCHGPEYDGMLASWQAAVAGQLAELRPRLDRALAALATEDGGSAVHPAGTLLREARENLDLVQRDGSRGAHNIDYALDALAASAERIDGAAALLGLAPIEPATAGAPFRSAHGCSTCHLGLEGSSAPSGETFPHAPHLAAALDCDTCHAVEPHGAPAPGREDCTTCHHAEAPDRDLAECAQCHGVQAGLLSGALPDLASLPGLAAHPGPMSDMDCSECHGEPPDLIHPTPAMCVLCHEPGYDRMQGAWQRAVGEQLARLEPALARLEREQALSPESSARLHEARLGLDLVRRDGSLGAHNPVAALALLSESAERLDRGLAHAGGEPAPALAAGFPYVSPSGCSTCHLGAESIVLPAQPEGQREAFAHGPHVTGAGLDCAVCHSVEEHGAPAAERASCSGCHHAEREAFDVRDCASCHARQVAFVRGEPSALASLPGFEPVPGAMLDKDCTECHGEPPGILVPPPAMCALCHDEEYAALPEAWQATTGELAARLEAALARAASVDGPSADPRAVEPGQAALQAVREDGSLGLHNADLARRLLERALEDL